MKYLEFQNGDKIPQLGLGTWKSNQGAVSNAVKIAIKYGYRHIDCAAIYGNEKEIGQALTELFDAGIVKRNELFITSKLWNDAHLEGEAQQALEKTLKNLQLDYLDLYLIHWPVSYKKGSKPPIDPADFFDLNEVPIINVWRQMEKIKNEGSVNHIGVSNFGIKHLNSLIRDCESMPEMNQVESHPFLPQNELFDYCTDHDILMTAYSPLGSLDRSEILKSENEPLLFDHEVIEDLSTRHNCSKAQLLIAWALHRGTAVIPKSSNEERIKENYNALHLALAPEEVSAIDTISESYRYITGQFWTVEGSPYSQEYLWGK